ncbi:MAG: hypothetical protein DHS20C18_38480 [Saprospiraceae bacterium]|nr:MAG: hypothetical protein DHS20C18_38480 [Saprospiraceae bacterium]
MAQRIYVAGTGQHIGKTTSTLGLMAALKSRFSRVGYCKPVGQEVVMQQNIRVDKDALLFSRVMGFTLEANVHSPVILGKGATTAYLDDPEGFNFDEQILHAANILDQRNDMVVYEGTGHPGVGSVVELSNAVVAKMLNAKVVLVVEGGIGNTIDKLSLSLALFNEMNVSVIGVIVNKVIPEKMDKVRHYVGGKLNLMGLKLLGVIPLDKSLGYAIMKTVEQAVQGTYHFYKENQANRIEGIVPGSLIEEIQDIEKSKNLLLVVSYKRAGEALKKLDIISKKAGMDKAPISGVLLTGEGRPDQPDHYQDFYLKYVEKHKIPVISTHLDTLGAFTKIERLEVKINYSTPWKVERAIELVKDNVNLDLIIDALNGRQVSEMPNGRDQFPK